jgi:hypothetical protein
LMNSKVERTRRCLRASGLCLEGRNFAFTLHMLNPHNVF